MIYEQHGFKILRDSKVDIDATVRVGKRFKYLFQARLTFEEKVTAKYGKQCIISVFLPMGEFPILEQTDYVIEYPRIEILVPETVARAMRLLK